MISQREASRHSIRPPKNEDALDQDIDASDMEEQQEDQGQVEEMDRVRWVEEGEEVEEVEVDETVHDEM